MLYLILLGIKSTTTTQQLDDW